MPMVHIYYAKKDKAVGGMGGGDYREKFNNGKR